MLLNTVRAAIEPRISKLRGGRRRPGEPPLVPARLPFLGHALAFGRDLPGLLRACQADHGDVFTVLVAGQRMTFILDPFAFPEVLKADALSFDSVGDAFSTRAFGHAPSEASGVEGAAMRSIFTEVLKGPALGPLAARTRERVDAHLAGVGGRGWQQGHLYAFVRRLVFAVNMETLFGDGAPASTSEADFRALDEAFPLLVAGVPARLLRGVLGARARLVAAIDRERADASAFVRVRDDYFRGRTTRHFRNHAQLAGLWAAEANTIPAIFWALYHLLADPEARAAVVAELRAVGGDLAEPATLKALKLCTSATLEALRLSSSSLVVRDVTRSFTLDLGAGGRHALRAGDRVCLAPELNHSDPEIFGEPGRYIVDRFVDGDGPRQFAKRGKRVPLALALMPFGAGVSMCPGRYLASNEILQVVAAMLLRFDLELLDRAVPALDRRRAGLGVLPPRSDPAFRLRRRASE